MAVAPVKYLRVPVLEVLPSSQDSQKIFNHWEKMLNNFFTAAGASSTETSTSSSTASSTTLNKLAILTGYISPDVYALIEQHETYAGAIDALRKLYKKKKNVVYARHLLATAKQDAGEAVTDFSQRLLTLARDCAFDEVTAEAHKNEAVRDALITGIYSSNIRLRLLEHEDLELDKAIQIADSLERAHASSSSYEPSTSSGLSLSSIQDSGRIAGGADLPTDQSSVLAPSSVAQSLVNQVGPGREHAKKCLFCGDIHVLRRKYCPARESKCYLCGRKGHFAKVCRSSSRVLGPAAAAAFPSAHLAVVPKSLERSAITISVGKRVIEALVDSGATENYMSQSLMNSLDLCLQGEQSTVTLASTDSVTKVLGSVEIAIEIQGRRYRNVKFGIVFNLCADIILGLDFLQKHRRVIFQFHGGVNDLSIGADAEHCAVPAAKIN